MHLLRHEKSGIKREGSEVKPSEVSAKLRQIAATIDRSRNPRRDLVASDIRKIVATMAGMWTMRSPMEHHGKEVTEKVDFKLPTSDILDPDVIEEMGFDVEEIGFTGEVTRNYISGEYKFNIRPYDLRTNRYLDTATSPIDSSLLEWDEIEKKAAEEACIHTLYEQ
jgi:hypothetical protein